MKTASPFRDLDTGSDRVRVTFDGLRPGLRASLKALERWHEVRPSLDEGTVDSEHLDREQVEALAFELSAAGKELDAVRLLRGKLGWSVKEAKLFLDGKLRRAA